MLYIREAAGTVEAAGKQLEAAAPANNMGVLGVHNLTEKMREKGVPFERQCRVYEVCNPHQAQKVLQADVSISTALPCRISIYEEDGKVKVATIKPTALLEMFGNAGLQPVAREVEESIVRIVDAACQ